MSVFKIADFDPKLVPALKQYWLQVTYTDSKIPNISSVFGGGGGKMGYP